MTEFYASPLSKDSITLCSSADRAEILLKRTSEAARLKRWKKPASVSEAQWMRHMMMTVLIADYNFFTGQDDDYDSFNSFGQFSARPFAASEQNRAMGVGCG